jgi:ubiquitin carboxyl-terminal hydrolase 34
LDFSFEKTNSAYMLFYEWRSNKGGNEQRDAEPSTSNAGEQLSGGPKDLDGFIGADEIMLPLFEVKNQQTTQGPSNNSPIHNKVPSSKPSTSGIRKSLLSKDLEDWIWQDNRNFLQDRNIFEHTYFK